MFSLPPILAFSVKFVSLAPSSLNFSSHCNSPSLSLPAPIQSAEAQYFRYIQPKKKKNCINHKYTIKNQPESLKGTRKKTKDGCGTGCLTWMRERQKTREREKKRIK